MRSRGAWTGLVAAALLAGCDDRERTAARTDALGVPDAWREDPGDPRSERIRHLVAVLHPTAGNAVRGTVEFVPAAEGLRVNADVRGLSPGPHGYHVHLFGDCTAPDATSAGPHFNFQGPSRNPPPDIDRITGDLGELTPGPDGRATATAVIERAEMTGPFTIVGRSVVVHAQGNDPTQPPEGGAGARVACGVIGIAD